MKIETVFASFLVFQIVLFIAWQVIQPREEVYHHLQPEDISADFADQQIQENLQYDQDFLMHQLARR